MGLLDGIIPTQNFELIRDRIAYIAALELQGQVDMASPAGVAPEVYIERNIRVDKEEVPLVNVLYGRSDYSNMNVRSVSGDNLFFIDVYTSSASTADDQGDKLASIILGKIMGQLRAIFQNPVYMRLGFAAPSIERVYVNAMYVADKDSVKDALCQTVGRIELMVKAPENVELKTATAFGGDDTTVKLSETDKGYKWVFNS
jgi:hypothetical protein